MKIKIKGIAPYPGLRDLLTKVVGEHSRFSIDVEIANLEDALPIVKRAEEENYDVIISRGGTASVIRQHVSIPVVDIPVSGYDILRVLTLIKDSHSRLAIIGFPNICRGALTVAGLLDFEIPIYPIHDGLEVRQTLKKAVREGAQIVLGDVVTVEMAQELGHHGILITSGEESITEMLSEVEHIYEIYQKENERASFFQQMVQQAPMGMMLVNQIGEIQYSNESVKQWIGDISSLPRELVFLLKETSRQWEHVWVGNRAYHVCAIPQQDGVLIYVEPDSHASNEWNLIQKKQQLASFAQIVGSSEQITKTIQRAITYAQTDKQVWLSGEVGTGKAVFAEAIHLSNSRNQGNFYRVMCSSAVSDDQLAAELFGTSTQIGLLQIGVNDTLYLEEVDRLSVPLQERLAQVLRKGTKLRIISSSRIPWSNLLTSGVFDPELLHLLGECQLVIPALRERKADIQEMIRVRIAQHNIVSDKQFVGLRKEVLTELLAYDWPGNLKELENIMDELFILSSGYYIGMDEWNQVRERIEAKAANITAANIDLTGTWNQIEKKILEVVLREEGMNQSKAAKRLGISRATLWRKLK
ncbi:sigma-54-dependent Fis family transcriptional regulator [Shimazuella alba]|uniref:Winged helix-turn-helix transcriptional regulator n=1 Tax=Shimazuella alba TaxID=2690964 RepID=A0A6I4VPH5_9BACL|nr:sigma-54-dependent Fis family transcriptional regulator [Shimazuella alba]MXQ53459.1 winged helix-turn-helix transcriptional regulator [Shimazuella alba]